MKLATVAAAVLVATTSTLSPILAGTDGDVNFFVGHKSLDYSAWNPVDGQFEFGAVMSFGENKWPVRIAVDVLTSSSQENVYDPAFGNVVVTGSTFEIDIGVRQIWKAKGKVRPYLGAGIGVIGATVDFDDGFSTVSASEVTFGLWAGGGVFFRLGSHFNIGLDARLSSAKVDLNLGYGIVVKEVNAGGLHYGLLLGFGW